MLLSSWTVGDSATLGTNQYLFTTVTGGPEHDATLSGNPGHIVHHSLCSSVTFAQSGGSLVCLEAVGHLRPALLPPRFVLPTYTTKVPYRFQQPRRLAA